MWAKTGMMRDKAKSKVASILSSIIRRRITIGLIIAVTFAMTLSLTVHDVKGIAKIIVSHGSSFLYNVSFFVTNPSARHLLPVRTAPATGPLRLNSRNPRYFTDGSGKAIMLAGAHTWYIMQDGSSSDSLQVFDYDTYLNIVEANNQNFFRTFVWEQARWSAGITGDWYISPNIYARPGPELALDGKPKFDLTQFNQLYFDRLRTRVIKAGKHGIYVSLQLFEGFSLNKDKASGNPWMGNPFNASNNINGINGNPSGDDTGFEVQRLFIPAVISLQEAYVRKVIDTVNDLDNVLFEICNESQGGAAEVAWQNHFIEYIHNYEATKHKQHPVGFTVPYPDGRNADLFASHADWISPNDAPGYPYKSNPPASDGAKVVISDTDHLWGVGGDRIWVWKSFIRGLNVLFMDPYDCKADNWASINCNPDNPAWVSVRQNLGYALSYSRRMNLVDMWPHGELVSSGYALANPVARGAEYLVFLPSGGSVTIDLTAASGNLNIEWFNPRNGYTINGGITMGGTNHTLTAPFSGDAVLYVHQE